MATQLDPIVVDQEPVQATPTDNAPISLFSPEAAQQSINLAPPGEAAQAPDVPTAQKKAFKTKYGLGDVITDPIAAVQKQFMDGQENAIRMKAALDMDFKKTQAKQQLIQDLAQKYGPLDPNTVSQILDPFHPNNKPTDPDTVIERAYSTKVISALNTAAGYMQDTQWEQTRQEMPQQVQDTTDRGSDLLTKREIVSTELDKINQIYNNQGILSWGADQLKNLSQVYQEVKLRGQNKDVGSISGGLFLGNNLKEQIDSLYELPVPEFAKRAPAILQGLAKDNPSLAKQFGEALLGQGTSDRMLSNIFTAIAPLDVFEGGKGALALTKKITKYNQLQKAVRDVAKAVENPKATESTIAEASGDVANSAVKKVIEDNQAKLAGSANPTQEVAEAMTKNFRLDVAKIDDNVGSLSREQVVRLKDNLTKQITDVDSTIANVNKVSRIPAVMTSEDSIRTVQNAIRNDYRGPQNTLLDVSTPRYNGFTNTWDYDLKIGNHNGELFSNPDTLNNFAKMYGFGDARIESTVGKVASAQSEKDIADIARVEDLKAKAQRLVSEHQKVLRDKASTKEMKKEARDTIKSIYEVGINKYNKQLADIRNRVNSTYGPFIEQQGVGYYLRVTRPLNETQTAIRDLMIKDSSGKVIPSSVSAASENGVGSWVKALVGKYRSADDTLAKQELKERAAAVYSESVLQKLAHNMSKSIEDLAAGRVRFDPFTGQKVPLISREVNTFLGKLNGGTKAAFKEWERAVDYAREAKDPATGKDGYFFKTPGELEDFYQRTFQRLPTPQEHLAYQSKVQLDEYHRVLTNIAVYRNKARLGTEQHALTYIDAGQRVQSSFFDGVQKKELPSGDGNILIMDSTTGNKGKIFAIDRMSSKDKERFNDGVRQGRYKIVEIFDPEVRPLSGFGDVGPQRVQYVLSDMIETKPLSYEQVNRRGGGHFEYEYEHYLKQANIKQEQVGNKFTSHYEGDTTVFPLKNAAMGKDLGEKLDTVRKLIKEKRIDEAKDFSQKHLGIEFKEINSWFNPSRGPDGKIIPPRLNLHEPFVVVPKNKSIFDIDKGLELRYSMRDEKGNLKSTFQDGTRHGSLARQFQVAYTKERDAFGLLSPDNIGTKERPLYAYQPAEMAGVLPTMNRALNRAIKSTFMDDYKMYAVEHWLREAEPYLKADLSEIRSSPFYHFNTATKGEFKSGTPEDTLRNLLTNKYKIDQFIGVPNQFDTWVHGITQHLVDAAYEKYGPKEGRSLYRQATTVVPIWLLSKVKDPITFIRSVTFNAKLGLFNLPQILVQAQTFASILAISPKHGSAGTYATLLHQWSRVAGSEEVLKSLDNYATKMNFLGVKWKPGEFLEARRELAKTGFENVAGEYAILDDTMAHKFIKNDFNKFLDLGQTFFREGERSTRIGAWYTAFKEFRDLHPTGLISNAERSEILKRADLLTTNMSRASNSALHGGVLSLTTQFLSYQLRLAELFLGKRLGETLAERNLTRMRMVGLYSALYGVPAAFGLTGLPVSGNIREAAINNGYVVGDNWMSSLAMEGIPSLVTALVTGDGDVKKGSFYNYGDRYGAQGFTQLREALRSDGTWWKILGGAGVSTFAAGIAGMDGATRAIWSFMRGDTGDQRFTLKSDDVIDAAKEISSVNAAWKLYVALNTGKWLAKNEGYITDVSGANALFMTAMGLSPQAQDDLYSKKNIVDAEKGVQKEATNKFIQNFHRGIMAAENGDQEGAHDYWRRAFSYLETAHFPMDRRAAVISMASKGWESRLDRADFNFYLKNVPTDKSATRLDAYKRQLDINQSRKQ